MKKRFFLTVLCALSFGGAFAADWYADLASYDAGKSQEWFHALRGQSTDKAKAAEIEKSILEVLSGRKVSDEAFRYSCIILKPIATGDSAKVLSKFLGDENRVVPACDVLQTLGGDSGKEVLLEALKASKNPKCAAAILNALASAEGCEAKIIDVALNSEDLGIRKQATLALGRSLNEGSVDALLKIAGERDARVVCAYLALCAQAQKALAAGNNALAKKAMAGVPVSFTMAVVSHGNVSADPQKFYDGLLMEAQKTPGKGKCALMAGRALSGIRDFDKSAGILENFANLNPRLKVIVIGSMIPTCDKRYWKYVAPEIDSDDADLRAEAVYAARFLCDDEASLRKIWELERGKDKTLAALARKVIEENPSEVVDKILREDGDSLRALSMRCRRADSEALSVLWKKYFDGGWKDKGVAAAVERTVDFGNVCAFASKMKSLNDEKLKMAIGRVVIKVLAAATKSGQSSEFMKKAFESTIASNLPETDPVYELAANRLGLKGKK